MEKASLPVNVRGSKTSLLKVPNKTIVELQSSFTNQTDRFWRILKNRGLAHLNNTSPPQPLVLLLAAPQLLTAQWTTWPGNLLQR